MLDRAGYFHQLSLGLQDVICRIGLWCLLCKDTASN